MKRHFLLAMTVVALTAISQRVFAAEVEAPAPRERAAPAQRAAPERAPARAPQRAPVQRQAQPSPSSSFTGSQLGGFGGGNAGGGGFADPQFCGGGNINSSSTAFSPTCPNTTQNISRSPVAFSGGAEYGYMFALGPYTAAGFAVDVTGSAMK